MNDDWDLSPFPEITDGVVRAVNRLLEELYTHFQNHDFIRMNVGSLLKRCVDRLSRRIGCYQ